MMPPLTEEERDRLLPDWAKEAEDTSVQRFAVGDRVYDVLYGPKFHNPFGTVVEVSADGLGIRVEQDDGGQASTISAYYVAVPLEHDPKRA